MCAILRLEHVSSGYVGFPKTQQSSGITASCPSWANFDGLRQACSIATGGDFQMKKYLEKPKHMA